MTALIKFESDFWQEQPQLAAHAVLLACARSDHPRSVVGVRRQRAHVCDLSSQDTQAGPPSRLAVAAPENGAIMCFAAPT